MALKNYICVFILIGINIINCKSINNDLNNINLNISTTDSIETSTDNNVNLDYTTIIDNTSNETDNLNNTDSTEKTVIDISTLAEEINDDNTNNIKSESLLNNNKTDELNIDENHKYSYIIDNINTTENNTIFNKTKINNKNKAKKTYDLKNDDLYLNMVKNKIKNLIREVSYKQFGNNTPDFNKMIKSYDTVEKIYNILDIKFKEIKNINLTKINNNNDDNDNDKNRCFLKQIYVVIIFESLIIFCCILFLMIIKKCMIDKNQYRLTATEEVIDNNKNNIRLKNINKNRRDSIFFG